MMGNATPCVCGRQGCPGHVAVDAGPSVVVQNADGVEARIYLDANGLVALIQILQGALRAMTQEGQT